MDVHVLMHCYDLFNLSSIEVSFAFGTLFIVIVISEIFHFFSLDAILTSLPVLQYHSFMRYLSFFFSASLHYCVPHIRLAACFKKVPRQETEFKSKATDENHHR